MIRIDLVVSSPIFLFGLVETLRSAGLAVVSTRATPDEQPLAPADVVVVDADALTPSRALEQITAAAANAAVLVLDTTVDTQARYVRAGATRVVSKRIPAEGLVRTIHAAVAGPAPGRDNPPDQPAQPLSEREEQVLRHISCGLTHGQIATRLGISPHTVDTYVTRIRVKLRAGNKAELTRAALLGGFAGTRAGGPGRSSAT